MGTEGEVRFRMRKWGETDVLGTEKGRGKLEYTEPKRGGSREKPGGLKDTSGEKPEKAEGLKTQGLRLR